MKLKVFGKTPSGERLAKIRSSPNYRDGRFQNLEPTSVNPGKVPFYRILKKIINRPASVRPAAAIPHIKTDLKKIRSDEPVVTWFGHSSYLIHSNGFNILVDPVFSGTASPFGFFGKAFKGTDVYAVDDLPQIDLLILSHDHYDHLDFSTVTAIGKQAKEIVTSLGVGAHLEYWGIDQQKIRELDWWQSHEISGDISITATPSRHFSGRGMHRAKTLWSSFVLDLFDSRIFIGSDSGYSSSFRKIGKEFGAFDLAFLECGQYGKYWPQIHMFPEQTVMAANDLNAQVVVPVHWAKFVLSTHPWNEPIERFVAAAKREKRRYISPKIGEAFLPGQDFEQEEWWKFEK